MRMQVIRCGALVIMAMLVAMGGAIRSGASPVALATATPTPQPAAALEVYATGLDNPRGLLFGPDGLLYIAEGGRGGTQRTTAKDCQQVPDPSGPYSGGMTARISKIGPDGKRVTVIDGLPSSQTSARSGSDVSGVAALAFLDNTLYAVTSGAGCSHGLKDTVNALLKISPDGKAEQIADLSSFFKANPTQVTDEADFEPDGDIYGMILVEGKFYILEANHGELDEITPDGKIRRVADITTSQGHSVPTALAYRDGKFYIGNLSIFPVHAGIARIITITPSGEVTMLAPHLTAVLAIAFDSQGQLYALETSTTDNKYPEQRSGAVVRIRSDAEEPDVIVTGLTFPTAMTFGPDGLLYIANRGYGLPPGWGQILRVAVPPIQN